jgi:hypothetical protein
MSIEDLVMKSMGFVPKAVPKARAVEVVGTGQLADGHRKA